MTSDQNTVFAGAASGIVAMILSLWLFYWLLPDPDAFGPADRVAYALKWNAVAAAPLFAMLVSIGNARFKSEAIDPTLGKESLTMIVDARVASNTLEQLLIFVVATLALAAASDGDAVKIVGAEEITFVIMRLAFWLGYRIRPIYRAFGFASNAYMNAGLLVAAIWMGFR
jgi:hypothetical protein